MSAAPVSVDEALLSTVATDLTLIIFTFSSCVTGRAVAAHALPTAEYQTLHTGPKPLVHGSTGLSDSDDRLHSSHVDSLLANTFAALGW